MYIAVADTHTVLWYLYQDPRLSDRAKDTIDRAVNSGSSILVSAITLVEMVYLIERSRITAESLSRLAEALIDPANVFEPYPVDMTVARILANVDRMQIPDMPDRIIAATALHNGIPVISRDGKIRTSGVDTIW